MEIIAPLSGFKLREGQTTAVRIRVGGGGRAVQAWTLRLVEPSGGEELEVAAGHAAVDGAVVAHVSADTLEKGKGYTLRLTAKDAAGRLATASVRFLVPDPQYRLLPLEEGNLSRSFVEGLSVDASGTLVAMGGNVAGEILLIRAQPGSLERITVPLGSTEGQKLSSNGQRFLFSGVFRQGDVVFLGLGFYDLERRMLGIVGRSTSSLFTSDSVGRRVAFQRLVHADPGAVKLDRTVQYFLYDEVTGSVRQLTNDPQAIVFGPLRDFCPQFSASIPLLSGDGATVILITHATLGVVPADPAIGCHIFAYDVASGTLRQVAALPREPVVARPTLSDDGRWLSFTLKQPLPSGLRFAFAALLDVHTGALTESVGGITDFVSFDSVVSGDGSGIVVSSQADLDPRVGNFEHTMQLFTYERASGRFTQITDTTGGIGRFSGVCPAFRPRVSADARVVAFSFKRFSGEGCQLVGPQRNEVDGFVFNRVRAVRKRPGNHGPVLQEVADARVVAGEPLTVPFTATDPDEDSIVFFAQMVGGMDVPPGSEIEDHRDGTATLRWPTKPEDVGLFRLRVAAFDEGGGEMFQDFRIAVCSRIVHDGNLPGVVAALFAAPEPPAPCRDADRNHDGVISAADAVAAARV